MGCVICNHEHRREIEECLMLRSYGNSGEVETNLGKIAEDFGVSVRDLQVHALMHTPLQEVLQCSDPMESIAGAVKKREANILSEVALEYMHTLRVVGKDIRETVADKNAGGAKLVTKQMVDLYIGAGSGACKAVESMVAMNQALNGEQGGGANVLLDVVKAIRGSQ